MIGKHHRLFQLKPWLVNALIPHGNAGAYLLYRSGQPIYAGRSDQDLRNRLVVHAQAGRADHFGFNVYPDAARAFDMECALFHALQGMTTNLAHPASPTGSGRPCLICGGSRKSNYFFRLSATN